MFPSKGQFFWLLRRLRAADFYHFWVTIDNPELTGLAKQLGIDFGFIRTAGGGASLLQKAGSRDIGVARVAGSLTLKMKHFPYFTNIFYIYLGNIYGHIF